MRVFAVRGSPSKERSFFFFAVRTWASVVTCLEVSHCIEVLPGGKRMVCDVWQRVTLGFGRGDSTLAMGSAGVHEATRRGLKVAKLPHLPYYNEKELSLCCRETVNT